MDRQRLYDGISKTAWGYLFLYLDINLGTVSILPAFVGYILFLAAFGLLEEEEKNLALLRPLGIMLAVWHGVKWLFSLGGVSLEEHSTVISLIATLVNLYFHFQLLTNYASLAGKYQPEGAELDKKLLNLRTVQTILLTALQMIMLPAVRFGEGWLYISFLLLIINLIACIWLMKTMFDFRKMFA